MTFEASTLFVVIVAATFANAALLGWSWWQNRSELSLLWMCAGFGVTGIGNLLLAGRATIPELLSSDLANGLFVCGLAMIWVVVRNFNNRPPPQWAAPAGFVVWMVLVQVPAIGDSFELRVVVFSTIGAIYCLLAARELWVRDGLKSRFPMAFLLGFHAVVLMLRIPAVLSEAGTLAPEFGGRWFAPMALEALVFIQALALFTLSLTKERAERRLRSMALTDPLTGLANRRAFFDQGSALIAGCVRGKRPTSLIAFDLDRFKQINDTYGHPFGDAVLEAFAAAAKTGLRAGDLIGRSGGEEFAAVLPGAGETEARTAAERVMQTFVDLMGPLAQDGAGSSASAGLAVSPASEESIEALLVAADRALYEAKREGGNRLRAAIPAFA